MPNVKSLIELEQFPLYGLYFTVYILFGAVASYCFLRVVFYHLLKLLFDESELYSNPKYKKSMNIFYHARLYPWPIWDEGKRRDWLKAWWKFAFLGLASFGLSMFALYMLELLKIKPS
jgi:hypothetical protein